MTIYRGVGRDKMSSIIFINGFMDIYMYIYTLKLFGRNASLSHALRFLYCNVEARALRTMSVGECFVLRRRSQEA